MMHSQAIGHLVRRGLELAAASPQDPSVDPIIPDTRPPWEIIKDELPAWAAAPLFLTILVFAVALISVRYTLMGVVATLAQVETPTAEYVSLQAPKNDDDPDADVDDPAPAYTDTDALNGAGEGPAAAAGADPEMLLVAHRPITSSIRGTIRHIHAIGGFAARWRGLSAAACTALVHSLLYQLLAVALAWTGMPIFLANTIGGVATTVVLARWYMAWTHIVISEPSALPWFRRVPTFRTWRNIWAPTAINALAAQVALLAPAGLFVALGMVDQHELAGMPPLTALWKLFFVFIVYLVVWIAIVLPSEVALTRCQASMLPDSDESVVPFDRSFGGKVTPAIVGGTGMLSFIDAWRSFDRRAMLRLVKLYAKIFAIDVSLHLLFGIVMTVELVVMLGPQAPKAALTGEA